MAATKAGATRASRSSKTPLIPEWSLGERIRKARRVAGMTTDELANRLGVSHGALGYWETGGKPRDLLEMVKKVSKITGVDEIWLLTGRGEPNVFFSGGAENTTFPGADPGAPLCFRSAS